MNFRPLFLTALTCAATLLISEKSHAGILDEMIVLHSYYGKLQSKVDMASGYDFGDVLDNEPMEKGISISSDGMSLDVKGVFNKVSAATGGYFSISHRFSTQLAAGAPVEVYLSTSFQFVLDQGGTVYVSPGVVSGGSGSYFATINGVEVYSPGIYVLNSGLNILSFWSDFDTPSLSGDVSADDTAHFWITAAVPEPGSWALMACGAGAAFLAARRKVSRNRA